MGSARAEAERQLGILDRGTVDILPREDLLGKLERSVREKRPLRVKLGVDPTAPDLHLGHAVVLGKLRAFQDLGHQGVLIVGDFTALVGDPSGQSKTRPPLAREAVESNAATYLEQAGDVLDLDRLEIRRNSEWFGGFTMERVLALCGRTTVARLLERDDFQKRYREGSPIGLHELLYPVMQGWDSVEVEADIELGGTDQTFNLMVGRDLQREEGKAPQVVMTLPLLEGTDGVRKMSKSYGNTVAFRDPPTEKFGKVMSIPDGMIRRYAELATDLDLDALDAEIASDPRNAKARVAAAIVARFHGEEAADQATAEFDRVFRKKDFPTEMPEYPLSAPMLEGGGAGVLDLLAHCGLASSRGEGRRLIRQGGVRLDGEVVSDEHARLPVADGAVLQVGKRRVVRLRIPS